MECTPEIRGVAEPERKSDILVRKICATEILERELSSQLIAQSAEGSLAAEAGAVTIWR
jgi:hypothetical protein